MLVLENGAASTRKCRDEMLTRFAFCPKILYLCISKNSIDPSAYMCRGLFVYKKILFLHKKEPVFK